MKYIFILIPFLAGCGIFQETPPTYSQFLNTDWTEVKADPGRILNEREKLVHKYGPTRAGEKNLILCGFVDFWEKIVWIARDPGCDIQKTRRHENCHRQAFLDGVEDKCHDGRRF